MISSFLIAFAVLAQTGSPVIEPQMAEFAREVSEGGLDGASLWSCAAWPMTGEALAPSDVAGVLHANAAFARYRALAACQATHGYTCVYRCSPVY